MKIFVIRVKSIDTGRRSALGRRWWKVGDLANEVVDGWTGEDNLEWSDDSTGTLYFDRSDAKKVVKKIQPRFDGVVTFEVVEFVEVTT